MSASVAEGLKPSATDADIGHGGTFSVRHYFPLLTHQMLAYSFYPSDENTRTGSQQGHYAKRELQVGDLGE